MRRVENMGLFNRLRSAVRWSPELGAVHDALTEGRQTVELAERLAADVSARSPRSVAQLFHPALKLLKATRDADKARRLLARADVESCRLGVGVDEVIPRMLSEEQ